MGDLPTINFRAAGLNIGGPPPAALRDAVAPAMLTSAELDVSDPESLLAFFSTQMSDARSQVSGLMQDQERRNAKVKSLQTAAAKLVPFEESGVPKGQEGAFLAAANEMLAVLDPNCQQAVDLRAMTATLGSATPKTHDVEVGLQRDGATLDYANAQSTAESFAREKNGTVEKLVGPHGNAVFRVHYQEAGTLPTKDQIKSLTTSIKVVTDSLQSESTMAMIRIQAGVEQMTQMTSFLTNIMKKQSDAINGVIGNLR